MKRMHKKKIHNYLINLLIILFKVDKFSLYCILSSVKIYFKYSKNWASINKIFKIKKLLNKPSEYKYWLSWITILEITITSNNN